MQLKSVAQGDQERSLEMDNGAFEKTGSCVESCGFYSCHSASATIKLLGDYIYIIYEKNEKKHQIKFMLFYSPKWLFDVIFFVGCISEKGFFLVRKQVQHLSPEATGHLSKPENP